jgi:hypothetical protein
MKPLHIARAQPGIYFNPVLPETIPVKDCLACEFTSKYYISILAHSSEADLLTTVIPPCCSPQARQPAGKQRQAQKQRQALLKLMRCAYQAGKKSKINDIYYRSLARRAIVKAVSLISMSRNDEKRNINVANGCR